MDEIVLMKPTPHYAEQVMTYRDEMLARGDSLDGCEGLEDVTSFEEWVDFDNRLKAKFGDSWVPSEAFIAVRQSDDRLVGIIDFRRQLSEFLLKYGGNIGYSVRPSERRKGYAGEMLRQMLDICREYGAARVLVTCDKDNEASRKTILSNGGVLENEVEDDVGLGHSKYIQRYWIAL